MQRLIRVVGTVAFLTGIGAQHAAGQSTDSMKDALLHRFDKNAEAMLELVSGLTDEQWNYKTSDDRWSISEVVEHIVLNEEWTYGLMTASLTEDTPTDETRMRAEAVERQLETTFRNRSQTFQAPDPLVPTGRWSGGSDVLDAFRTHRSSWRQFIERADFDLRSRKAPHPILGPVDVHQWGVVVVEHGDRHLAQIREVMEDPGYPGA